jgi:hypothetical protein
MVETALSGSTFKVNYNPLGIFTLIEILFKVASIIVPSVMVV